jgi:hypothetical protein
MTKRAAPVRLSTRDSKDRRALGEKGNNLCPLDCSPRPRIVALAQRGHGIRVKYERPAGQALEACVRVSARAFRPQSVQRVRVGAQKIGEV